jgi:hypothetical protein
MKKKMLRMFIEELDEIRSTPDRDIKAYEKRRRVTERVIRDLKSRGAFFKTARGHFYFEKQPPKLYPIQSDSISLSSLMADRYGTNRAERTEYDHIISSLHTECESRGKSVDVHRLSYYDDETGRLYVSRFDGSVYRLNGRSILPVLNGTDGVFFWDDPDWRPYEVFRRKGRRKASSGLLKPLIFDSANFGGATGLTVEDQRWLFSVWLRSHFFSSLLPTKPLLLAWGDKGSGKSLALRKWLRLLFGPAGEVLGLERDKADGFIAAVCSKPIAVFDNVDERVSWLPDHLTQLATGISFMRRKLYTTNDEIAFKPECFVGLTSRTPKFIDGREDVLDRTLIVHAERLPDYRPENELLEEIAKHRNSLWTELLRGLNGLLSVTPNRGYFQTYRGAFRMADFAGFLLAVARAEGEIERATRILRQLEVGRAEMLVHSETIFLVLEKWLEDPAHVGLQVTSSRLQQELAPVASANGLPWPYTNGHSLGQRLSHIQTNLEQLFRVDVTRDTANQRRYRFWPRPESLNRPESQSEELQAA